MLFLFRAYHQRHLILSKGGLAVEVLGEGNAEDGATGFGAGVIGGVEGVNLYTVSLSINHYLIFRLLI